MFRFLTADHNRLLPVEKPNHEPLREEPEPHDPFPPGRSAAFRLSREESTKLGIQYARDPYKKEPERDPVSDKFFFVKPSVEQRRMPQRGMRTVDAEVVHHYPGYVNPLVPTTRQAGYMGEAHRLHPFLTVDDELRHERRMDRQKKESNTELRRRRFQQREEALQRERDAEFARQKRHAAQVAGTNLKNIGSDNRDVITHQCHTKEAQDFVTYKEDLGKYRYHLRQRRVEERSCPTGFNTITWEPRPQVQVPPLPNLPETVDPRKLYER